MSTVFTTKLSRLRIRVAMLVSEDRLALLLKPYSTTYN